MRAPERLFLSSQVALMKQMKEEQQRRRMVEAKRTREIAQLKKEQRRQEVRTRVCSHEVRKYGNVSNLNAPPPTISTRFERLSPRSGSRSWCCAGKPRR